MRKKLATAVLITASVASFAALGNVGDGGGSKKVAHHKSLLSTKTYDYNFKTFSLKSGYNYRGNNLFSQPEKGNFIMLNTVVTYQKGNSTYILPMKKKVLLDKITFNPATNR